METDTLMKLEPYVGCTFSTTKGVVIIEGSVESEPDGFGGFLYDLTVRHIKTQRVETMVNLSAHVIETALNRHEIDALAEYERGLERNHARHMVATCPRCGDLTMVPDKFAKARVETAHYQLHHSDS